MTGNIECVSNTSNLISALTRLGFSRYEAKAYVALVGQPPMNGSEVSRRADMPPSKIYETLARLEAKGAVLVNHSEPVRYTAVSPKNVLTVLRDKFAADLSTVQEELADLPENREPGLVWSLHSRDAIVQASIRLINEAKHTVFAGVWDEEMDDLGPLLDNAAVRGLDVHVAIYGTSTLAHPHTYDMNECGTSARLRLSGRRLAVVVADDNHTLVASFGDRTPDEAVLTTNPVTSLLAVEYIKADISGRLMINAMTPQAYQDLLKTQDMQNMLVHVE